MVLRNSLKMMGYTADDIIPEGGFGAVLARSGVGKTSLMVQLSLNSLLRERKVLHLSLDDHVDKICLWYSEMYDSLVDAFNIPDKTQQWESILRRRFIMTFRVEGFSVPKLEERLTDLTSQDIISPQTMIIDGLPFDESIRSTLSDIKDLAAKRSMQVWFTVLTHRDDEVGSNGIPPQLKNLDDMFDAVIQLQPENGKIHVKALKGSSPVSKKTSMIMDPSTMLIKEDIV